MAQENNTQAPPAGPMQFPPPPENTQEQWSMGVRKMLNEFTDKYFAALLAHDSSRLQFASGARYTENGKDVRIGAGFWQTAGKILLKRTLVDTRKFGTYSYTIIEENGKQVIFSVRIGFDHGKIKEIETIIAREGDFAFNPKGVLATKDENWEEILTAEERISRLAMIAAANDYFDMFAHDPEVSTPFNEVCDRWENGTQTTVKMDRGALPPGTPQLDFPEHNCSPKGLPIYNHGPRRFLVDVEAGTVAAFMHFASGLPDCHYFKMKNGKVDLIHATVGSACESIGWPVPSIDI